MGEAIGFAILELFKPNAGVHANVALGEFAIAFKLTVEPAQTEVEPPGVIVTAVAGFTTIC